MQLITHQDASTVPYQNNKIHRKEILKMLKLDELIDQYDDKFQKSMQIKESQTHCPNSKVNNFIQQKGISSKTQHSNRKTNEKYNNKKEQVLYRNYGSEKRCQSQRIFKKRPNIKAQNKRQENLGLNVSRNQKINTFLQKTSLNTVINPVKTEVSNTNRRKAATIHHNSQALKRNAVAVDQQRYIENTNQKQKLKLFIEKYKSNYGFKKNQKDKQSDRQYLEIEAIANQIKISTKAKNVQLCPTNQSDAKEIQEDDTQPLQNLNNNSTQEKFRRKSKMLNKVLKDRYKILNLIGHGLSGSVFKAKDVLSDRFVAIKVIDPKSEYQIQYEFFKQIEHPNIVQYYNNFIQNGRRYIVLEYFPDTLQTALKNRIFTQNQKKKIFKNVVNGLMYLHGLSIAHRDIKLENIVISSDLSSVKFIDFGLCIDLSKDKSALSKKFCGTLQYMSPQILQRKEYDPRQADIWSLGVLLYFLMFKRFPFRGKEERQLLMKINRNKIAFSEEIDENLKDLISNMLKITPKQRMPIIEIYNHAWLTE